jgi:Carboxypeptidase regulatory-like domain/PDZ domain
MVPPSPRTPSPPPPGRVRRAGLAIAAAAAALLALGGIPGAALRTVVPDVDVRAPIAVPDLAPPHDGRVEVGVWRRAPASSAAPVAGQDAEQDAGQGGRSRGAPIAGARVLVFAILDERAYLVDSRESDAEGRVTLRGLLRGVTWIVADAPGCARASSHLVVDEEPRAVDLVLGPEHVVDVAVRDEVGAGIAQAELEVVASDDPLPVGARTGSDGRVRVGRLGAGPWRVTARAAGYEDGTGRAEGVEGERDPVAIVLRRLGSLWIHVVAAQEPAARARVSVAGATLWPARSAETDDHGDVRVAGLAAGSYALRATRGDLVSPIELGVPLERGEDKSVVLRMSPGRWAAVRVTDGDGEDAAAIGSARVTLAEGGLSPFPFEATTDAKGRARLGPIAAEPATAATLATVTVHAEGFVSRAVSLEGAGPPAPPSPAKGSGAETRAPEMRIALVRAGVVTGRVVDERGFPIDGATVEIVGNDLTGAPILDDPSRLSFRTAHFDAMLAGPAPLVAMGELGVMPGPVPPVPRSAGLEWPASARPPVDLEPWVTRADGTFRAAPASPGRVRVIVRHPEYVESESEPITLGPGSEENVDVVMHRGGALEGRVVDARDRPVARARVLVSAARGTLERTTLTASDGSFAFAALPDAVSVTASVDDDEDQPDVRVSVTIPEMGRNDVTIRLPEARGALAVTVVDDHDWPVESAQVSASSLSVDVPLRATAFTDAHGDAAIKRARGLPLRLETRAPGHAPRFVTVDGSGDAVRIALAPAETATGRVVAMRGGQPIAGAQVTLSTDLGVRRARTDDGGAFALPELGAGGARLRVVAPGFGALSRSIEIPGSGGRGPFEMAPIELAVEGVVEGDVVDARGDPVAGARVAQDHAPTWLVVGADAEGAAVTGADGRFSLRELPEGMIDLEAYAPGIGRARVEGVKVVSGRTTSRVRIEMARTRDEEADAGGSGASGNVAVALGEAGDPPQVVVVSVAVGSEAERAGLAPGDVLLAVDDAPVRTIGEARGRLAGPLTDDAVVRVRRGDEETSLRVAREAVRR